MHEIDAIILVGGMGTRLREVVPDMPKPLALVDGKPFLGILLDFLKTCPSVRQVVLAAGYRAELVMQAFGGRTDYPFRISFSVEEKPLGTGGAIRKALSLAETETVLVMNGDSFVDVDLGKLLETHSRQGFPVTLVGCRVGNADRYGTLKIDRAGKIVTFEEKKPGTGGGTINAGVYLIDRHLFDGIEDGRPLSLERDLLPTWVSLGIHAFLCNGKFIDIGVPESYRDAPEYLKEYLQ